MTGGVTGHRPALVWVAAGLLIVSGVLAAAGNALALGWALDRGAAGPVLSTLLAATVALSVAQVVSGVFLLPGRRWARLTAITLCAFNAVAALLSLTSGVGLSALAGAAVSLGVIVILNRADVAGWCG